MTDQRLYKVIFFNQAQLYELFARRVGQAELFGFIEIEELVFGARSSLVVDPSEERLQKEFEGVRRFIVPLHSVVRIDEVEREGPSRILPGGEAGKVAPFPLPFLRPPDSKP
jgi:hypothetical protein